MADSPVYFAVKTIGMSRACGHKPCSLYNAARHNLREIEAERGPYGKIDPQRSPLNEILSGTSTAQGVHDLAQTLLSEAAIPALRKDHVQAVEVLFSLPTATPQGIAPRHYFEQCLAWLRRAMPLPQLLATIHHDEAAPHMHVLLLPLQDGKHTGGALNTKPNLKKLRDLFFDQVSGPAGLPRPNAKLYGSAKKTAISLVLKECEIHALPQHMGPLWPVLKFQSKSTQEPP